MKKLKLLAFSVSPFVIGYLVNLLIYNFDWYGRIISVISILFCLYWYFVGYKSYDYVKSMKISILLGNCFSIINIILILFQSLVLGRFMPNIIGVYPQHFFLPMIRVSSWVDRIVLFFIPVTSMTIIFIISFILMMILYYIGYKRRFKSQR